jgi:hypothetical protein
MFHAVLERNKLMPCLFWYVLMFLFTNFDWCLSSWQDATICRHFTGPHIPKFLLGFEKPSLFRESSSWKCIPKMQFIECIEILISVWWSTFNYFDFSYWILLNIDYPNISQSSKGKAQGLALSSGADGGWGSSDWPQGLLAGHQDSWHMSREPCMVHSAACGCHIKFAIYIYTYVCNIQTIDS